MSNLTEQKKQTVTFTVEGHEKVKEMAKRYGVNQWMMLDAMIYSVDEQSKEFKDRVDEWQDIKGAKKNIQRDVAVALNEVTQGMDADAVKELLQRAKQLKETEQ